MCGRNRPVQALRSLCRISSFSGLKSWGKLFTSRSCAWLCVVRANTRQTKMCPTFFWFHPVLQGRSQTCGGQCLFYPTGSESSCNWAEAVLQVRARAAAAFLQRWLHTFHSLMKPFNDSSPRHTHARACTNTHTFHWCTSLVYIQYFEMVTWTLDEH